MKKFFSKLLGKRELEVRIVNLESMVKSYEVLVASLDQQLALAKKEVKDVKNSAPRRAKSVKKVNPEALYWVVTQGGYYTIRGRKLVNSPSEVTQRAYKNGFVVETEREAKVLAEALKSLVGVSALEA